MSVLAAAALATGVWTLLEAEVPEPLLSSAAPAAGSPEDAAGPEGARASAATLTAPPTEPPRHFAATPERRGALRGDLVAVLRGRGGPRSSAPRTLAAARARLARARGWVASLEAFDRLPGRDDPAEALGHAAAVREASSDPVVDQNLIFHVAISFPPEVAFPWLREVLRSEDPADREDALVALAFAGDAASVAEFETLARTPSGAEVRRLLDGPRDFEAFAAGGGAAVRGVLRSYRAIEVLDREPYFKRTLLEVRFRWPVESAVPAATRRRLHAAWLARYPGHPGSDDVARRIAWFHLDAAEPLEAARWFSRAAVLPDQDVASACVEWLAGLAELALERRDVARLLDDREDGPRNRSLLQYVLVRRTAAEAGPAAGLAELGRIASGEPRSPLAEAWRRRWAVAVPRGLDSGLAPLPPDDPLRRVERAPPLPPADPEALERGVATAVHGWPWSAYEAGQGGPGRLDPWREAVLLDVLRVAQQARAWETLAALEDRAARARGNARADLLYKQAAVWFHDPDVLFPAYGYPTSNFRSVYRRVAWRGSDDESFRRARAAFEERAFSWFRALDLFDLLERDHPGYPAMDRVHFSEALCWKRLADYPPHGARTDAAMRRDTLRRCVAALEACVRDDSRGPLADDAERAIAYWRRTRPDLLGR